MSRLSVMVWDDCAGEREATIRCLRKFGYKVETVAGTVEVRHRLEAGHPDALVLDCEVACAESRSLVKEIKSDPRWNDLVVLAVTNCTRLDTGCQAGAEGFDGWMHKADLPAVGHALTSLLKGPVA